MKCVKSGDKIKRVKEDVASDLVRHGWAYCPKWEYKSYQRTGTVEKAPNAVEGEKAEEKKPRKKRAKKAKSKTV